MKALNYGSLNIDYVYKVEHFVRGGETISSAARNCFCGGKGLNQSIALAKAGAEVYHAGAVGIEDGAMLLEALSSAGVDISMIEKKNMPTGHAVIQNIPEGDNCIILFGGANQSIEKAEIEHVLDKFDAGDILILQNEINNNAYIIEEAHKKGLKIVLNPSPMDEAIGKLPLEFVDYLILNEIEAGEILKSDDESDESLEDRLAKQFPDKEIVLTLGGAGSVYIHGNERIRQQIYKVHAVDTTAAGDTFTGYFYAGIMKGLPVKECLELAAKASAIAVTRPGASPSIPWMDEVVKYRFE